MVSSTETGEGPAAACGRQRGRRTGVQCAAGCGECGAVGAWVRDGAALPSLGRGWGRGRRAGKNESGAGGIGIEGGNSGVDGGERVQRGAGREASVAMDGAGRQLTVRGHRGILEYGSAVLRLRLPVGALVIEGEGLTLERMDGEDVAVAGRIDAVRLVR